MIVSRSLDVVQTGRIRGLENSLLAGKVEEGIDFGLYFTFWTTFRGIKFQEIFRIVSGRIYSFRGRMSSKFSGSEEYFVSCELDNAKVGTIFSKRSDVLWKLIYHWWLEISF